MAISAEKTLQRKLAALQSRIASGMPHAQEALLQEIYAEIVGVPAQGYPSSVEAMLGRILSHLTGQRVSGRLSKEFLVRQLAGVVGGMSYEAGLTEAVLARYNYQVAQSLDDAWEVEQIGDVYVDVATLECISNTAPVLRVWTGIRFAAAPLPPFGSIITSAYVSVNLSVGADDPRLDIYAQKAASPENFTGGAANYNITSRPRTIAYTEWVADNLGVGWVRSPDFSLVIQELVDSYNIGAIALIFKPKTNILKFFYMDSWDKASHVLGPILHLEWK